MTSKATHRSRATRPTAAQWPAPAPPQTRTLGAALTFVLTCLLLACDDDGATPESPTWLVGGVAVGEHALLVDTSTDTAFIVDGERPAVVTTTPIAPNAIWLGRRLSYDDSALVLSAGRRGVGQGAVLTLVRDNGDTRAYDLNAPFNRVVQTPDGRFAVLFFERGVRDLAFSPNDIAVVDMEADRERDAVTHTTLRTPLGALNDVVASPRLRVTPERAHLAVATSPGYLSILDLNSPAHPDILVQLGGRELHPEQLLFSAERAEIYVRAEGSDDAFVLAFDEADREHNNRIWPEVRQLAVGGGFTDLTIAGSDESGRLLATTPTTGHLHLLEVDAGTSHHIDLGGEASRLLRFQDSPGDSQVLAFEPGTHEIRIISPEGIADNPFEAIRRMETHAPVESVMLVGKQEQVLLSHPDSTVSLWKGGEDAPRRLSVNTDLDNLHFDSQIGQLVVAEPGAPLLSMVQLDSQQSDEVLLDAPTDFVVPVPLSDRLVVVHTDATISLIDLERPRRATLERLTELR
ncbi:MAG: hypothetical protein OXU20_18385 [Myxococcales bacterium]|nr:hypothetical protein [Myxococcales bacterium]